MINNNKNIIPYSTFQNKRKATTNKKAEEMLKNIVYDCYKSGTELTEDLLKEKFRESGMEKELINLGLWDKKMAKE